MIISSLCEYYGYMVKNGKANKPGYKPIDIEYLVCLGKDGTIKDILPLFKKDGKQKSIQSFLFPNRMGKTGTEAKALEYRAIYLFGLNYEKGQLTTEDKTDKAKKSHKVFVESHLKFTEGMQSPLVQAFRKFMENWNPAAETKNKYLLSLKGGYNSKFAFCLSGKINDYLQDEKEIKEKWEKEFAFSQQNTSPVLATCPVYGEKLPVAKVHDSISGIDGASRQGSKIICCNNESEYSYGKEQSYNSGISERAMNEYTEALNYLLKSPNHHNVLGDVTIGYFALTNNKEDDYANAISFVFNYSAPLVEEVQKEADADTVNANLNNAAGNAVKGKQINFSYFDGLDENVRYCIFGYYPIESRAALKFFYTDTFGKLRENIEKWHKDFAIGDKTYAPSFAKIAFQLMRSARSNDDENDDNGNKGSKEEREKKKKIYSELVECLLNSAVNAKPIPEKIFETVIRRIKTDSCGEKSHSTKMNDTRIGLLKACLNRRNKDGKEEITVSLNLENKNPAYLCGRLFAVLEKVQKDAADGELNKTIKDNYFSSAAATPRTVFVALMKLNTHHMAKLVAGRKCYFNSLIGSILDDLEEFPKTLSLEQQGNFIIGYYQQNQDFYTPKSKKEDL